MTDHVDDIPLHSEQLGKNIIFTKYFKILTEQSI
jgi:hypothetical protein